MARIKEELKIFPCCSKCKKPCKRYTGVEMEKGNKNDIVMCPFKNK